MRAIVLAVLLASACALPPPASEGLAGTQWRLVRFQGGDGTVLVPDDRTKYTIAFMSDGTLSVRFDCNRGRGSWSASQGNVISFGPMALTRAMCPPGSLHDHLVHQWPHVRSYMQKNGRLYLSLMADGGIFEFEPGR